MMTAAPQGVTSIVGGADAHAETIHVAAIDTMGRELGDREFPTTPEGYRHALAFLAGFGVLTFLRVEGTSSYGAGLARPAQAAGVAVREVTRADRATDEGGASPTRSMPTRPPAPLSPAPPTPSPRTSASRRSALSTSPDGQRSRHGPRR